MLRRSTSLQTFRSSRNVLRWIQSHHHTSELCDYTTQRKWEFRGIHSTSQEQGSHNAMGTIHWMHHAEWSVISHRTTELLKFASIPGQHSIHVDVQGSEQDELHPNRSTLNVTRKVLPEY